jgi:serine-type D-Ala-D-Ala carboxypeptidase (penicillin-binding protein 5/6)
MGAGPQSASGSFRTDIRRVALINLLSLALATRQTESGEYSHQSRQHSNAARVVRQVVGLVLFAAAVIGNLGFGPPVITGGDYPMLRLDPDTVEAVWQSSHPPGVTAGAAVVVDLSSGQMLYGLRPEDRLPPASTVKIMTAFVTLKRANLDDVVQVSAEAASTEGSRMGLAAGEKLTVRDLLYGLLLPSGNDAAVALAEHISGTEKEFVALMNETAAGLDMRETHFTSPHGLDDPGETVSAADLVTLTTAAFAYPVFSDIVATPAADVAGHKLVNTNQLLSTYLGADGVKTGTTDAAGECLVASASRNGHRMLVVLLGSQNRYEEATLLLDWATKWWQWRRVDLPDNALAWEIDSAGKRHRLRASESQDVLLLSWQWPLTGPNRMLDSAVPLTSTSPVGTLTLALGSSHLAQLPLFVWPNP